MLNPKEMLKNWALKNLCNGILESGFLEVKFTNPAKTEGAIYEDGTKLEENLTKELASEARVITKLGVYRRAIDSIRVHATDRLVNKSTNIEDMVFAKAMLYTLDVFQKKIENIARLP